MIDVTELRQGDIIKLSDSDGYSVIGIFVRIDDSDDDYAGGDLLHVVICDNTKLRMAKFFYPFGLFGRKLEILA